MHGQHSLRAVWQALDKMLHDAMESAVLEPAAAAVETHLRLALFAVDAACASNPGDAGAAAAAKAAAEAAAEAQWVAPLVALPPLRLVTTTVHIRCTTTHGL